MNKSKGLKLDILYNILKKKIEEFTNCFEISYIYYLICIFEYLLHIVNIIIA